jgi:transcriptional antiterminator
MNLKNMQLLIELIKQRNTGNPKKIAEILGVSERQVYTYLEILKIEFRVPIKYNKKEKTYFFTEEGELKLQWQEEISKNK